MGPFKCPHCDESIELFSSGGGKATAEQFGLNFLGSIPFDINIGKSGDSGKPLMMQETDSEFEKNFENIVANITKQL